MTSAKIEQIPLGAPGLKYVLGQLKRGNTLSQFLVPQWTEFRHAYTFLPQPIGPASLTDFASGGKLPRGTPQGDEYIVRTPDTNAVLCGIILAHLEAEKMNVCVFEDFLARRDDPSLSSFPGVFFSDREVYHFLLSSDREGSILSTLHAAHSIPQFVGVLSRCPVHRSTLEHASVTRDLLESLARDANAIIAGAYDGESYVIAER